MYALVDGDKFVRWVDLRKDYPNTSFPFEVKSSDLPAGVVFVEDVEPPSVGLLEVAEVSGAAQVSGSWRTAYAVRPMNQQEAESALAAKAAQVRADRNWKLTTSDWTQVADAPVDKAAWAAYRQALRDVTEQAGFPFDVQWPQMPA